MSRHLSLTLFIPVTVSLLLLFTVTHAVAQEDGIRVEITRSDNDAFPTIAVFAAVSSGDGTPVIGLTEADFVILEDGEEISSDSVVVEDDAAQDLSVVLAIDVSMSEDDLTKLKIAARAFGESMQPRDQIAAVEFFDVVNVVQEFTGDATALTGAIDTLTAGGNYTALYEGTAEAVTLAGAAETGRRAVVILTNSDNNTGDMAVDVVVSHAQAASVPLYTIGFGDRVNASALRDLARLTGGQSFLLSGPAEIQATLQSLEVVLRQGYRITYTSNQMADGKEHELSVFVSSEGGEGRATTSFKIDPIPVSVAVPAFTGGEVIGVVDLAAQVTASAPVASVEYLLDDELLTTLTAPPYRFSWDSSSVEPGVHVLTVQAIDEAGNQGFIQLDVTVQPPEPMIVTAATDETQYRLGSEVTVTAEVVPETYVQQVDFLLGDELLGSDDVSPYIFTFNNEKYEAGEHTITVRSQDSAGQVSETVVNVEFSAPFALPRISISRESIVNILLILGILATVVSAIYLVSWLIRAQKRSLERVYALEIVNDGNIGSCFELKAEDPTNFLGFKFLLNGVNLSHQEEIVEEEQAVGTVAAPATTTTQTLAAPAMPAAAPVAVAAPAAQPAAAPVAAAAPASAPPAPPAAGGAKASAKKAAKTGGLLVSIAGTLGGLLPGSLGRPLLEFKTRAMEAQTQAQMAKDRQMAAKRSVNTMGQQSKKLGGAGQQTAASKDTPTPAMAQPAQSASVSAAPPMASSTVSAPAQPMTGVQASAQPNQKKSRAAKKKHIAVKVLEWARTPVVEAGQSLTINLQVTPSAMPETQVYFYKIISRPADAEDAPPMVEQGGAELKRPSVFRRLLPGGVALVSLVIVGLLVRYLLLNFGVLL